MNLSVLYWFQFDSIHIVVSLLIDLIALEHTPLTLLREDQDFSRHRKMSPISIYH